MDRCSQLEEQRLYYERLLTTANQCDNSIASITLEQEVRHLKKSNEILQQKATKSEEELDFVRYTIRCDIYWLEY